MDSEPIRELRWSRPFATSTFSAAGSDHESQSPVAWCMNQQVYTVSRDPVVPSQKVGDYLCRRQEGPVVPPEVRYVDPKEVWSPGWKPQPTTKEPPDRTPRKKVQVRHIMSSVTYYPRRISLSTREWCKASRPRRSLTSWRAWWMGRNRRASAD